MSTTPYLRIEHWMDEEERLTHAKALQGGLTNDEAAASGK